MKVLSVVGARPQFIKAAAMSRVLRQRHTEILVHTGQHYDYEMSGVFFDGLEIPVPEVNLGVGSGSHGHQTAAMLSGIEGVLLAEKPDALLVYGDTNSTLAGALAASKLSVPIAHVEAGLRSFNRQMPEEINRVVADHLSSLLFCPSDVAVRNLAAEGITAQVYIVGDVMRDVLNWAVQRLDGQPSHTLRQLDLRNKQYLLATVHRSENTDDYSRLASILESFASLGEPVIFPVHPRTLKAIQKLTVRLPVDVHLIDPVGYLEMVALTQAARLVLTDSGGLQKEAYWLGVPCVTLRDETEWVETVETGWNTLAGANASTIRGVVKRATAPAVHPALYGHGDAAARCVALLQGAPIAAGPCEIGRP
jgi:UDP-N-acetylglucosamine 2-epimerase